MSSWTAALFGRADEQPVDYGLLNEQPLQAQSGLHARGQEAAVAPADREARFDLGSAQALRPLWTRGPVGGGGGGGAEPTAPDREEPDERRQRLADQAEDDIDKEAARDPSIATVNDAYLHCEALVEKQLKSAYAQSAPMNEPIYGDAQTRRAIRTLLPDAEIRTLFLRTTRVTRSWPRLRPLFGAPPYNFLRPEDAGLMRAAGFSTSRKNLAYENSNEAAAYAQFGSAHLVDQYLREYRVLSDAKEKPTDPLPYDLETVSAKAFVAMNVRVPKRRMQDKMRILKDRLKRHSLVFPSVGEVLSMRYSPDLLLMWGKSTETEERVDIKVVRVVPRSLKASTGTVLAVRV